MAFVSENDLEAALMRAAKEPSARPAFYRLLLTSNLFVIARIEGRKLTPGDNALKPGERIQMATGDLNGKRFHPVFTSLKRLQENNRDNAEWMSLNGRALFQMTKGATFVLNPGAEYGKELPPEEIAWMLAPPKVESVTLDKPTQVMIGQPAIYPHALVDALKAMFAGHPEVAAAHLVQIAYSNGEPHPLIGVETAGDWKSLADEMAGVVAAAAPGTRVDLAQIDREEGAGLTPHFATVAPFYTRAG
jgi:type III secretion system (T3SS) SseB-like protein